MDQKWTNAEDRRKFIESQGLIYLSHSEYQGLPVFQKDQTLSPYYQDNKEEFESLFHDYSSMIQKGQMAELSIRRVSDDVGYGLYTEETLKAGAFIGEYTGIVQPGSEILADPEQVTKESVFETDYTWDYPDAWYEDILYEVNAGKKGNELRYANHSFEPNLAVEHTLVDNKWVIFFVALKPIQAGCQLTVDYGEEYWSGGFRELILF